MAYIIEVILFQAMFLGLYYILKNETFFNNNRVYLLATSLLSYALPFVKLDIFKTDISNVNVVQMLPPVFIGDNTQGVVINSTNTDLFIWHWWYVLLLGSIVMLLMFITKLYKMVKLISVNEVIKKQTYKIVVLDKSNTAFSFFNWVFIGDQLKEDERKIVLQHELIHVKEKHSLDILLFEIQRIVCWFNPLVYLYQREIKTLHEFIVDQQMIKNTGTQAYCKNMLTQLFKAPELSFVNTFYKKSIIKKRIAMITKKQSKTTAKIKYTLIIPVLMGMLFYTSCKSKKSVLQENPKEVSKVQNISTTAKTTEVYEDVPFAAVQNSAVFPGCEDEEDAKKCFSNSVNKFISKNFNIKLAEELGLVGVQRMAAKFKINVEGKVTDIRLKAENDDLKAEFKRVLESLPQMQPATQNGENVNMLFSLPLVFRVGPRPAEKQREKLSTVIHISKRGAIAYREEVLPKMKLIIKNIKNQNNTYLLPSDFVVY